MPDIRKVLIVNKYYFVSGGAERYCLSVAEALKKAGVEPVPFAVNYRQTLPNPYQRYFVEPVGSGEQHKIQNQKPALREQARLASRAVYNSAAKRAVSKLIEDTKPDIAYLLNINNHISPSVIDACAALGVPVVMRLSDFNLTCASNMYFRDGHPCTDCKSGFHHALAHRCVHGSFLKTAAVVFANSAHRWSGVYKKVDAFVAPSHYMKKDLEGLGFAPEKIHQINTFASPEGAVQPDRENPYIIYSGRFADYKGADLALEAFSRARNTRNVSFYVVGDEGDADARRIHEAAERLQVKNVKILPFERDKKKLISLIQRSLFVLVPSRFYENLPNSILEAFGCGKPVIGTDLGSIPEVVRDGKNGLLFRPEDAADFAAKIDTLLENDGLRETMGRQALDTLLNEYSEEGHTKKLMTVFRSVKKC